LSSFINNFGRLSVTFSSDDSSFSFLFSHSDSELGLLGLLESDLLHFDRLREISGEVEVSDGDIIEENVELSASLSKVLSNLS